MPASFFLASLGEPIWLAQAGKVSFARPSKARQASKRTKHALTHKSQALNIEVGSILEDLYVQHDSRDG